MEEKTLAVEGRTKEQKRKERDKAELLLQQEKRAALKAAQVKKICTNKIEEFTKLPLSGRLQSKDGKIYHMKKEGILTALYLDGFENQAFLLDSQDLYRFIWQHELSYLTPEGCIKKLFHNATTAETYIKNGTHCVWSPLTGYWERLNAEILNNGKIANETDSLPTGAYMAVESDFNISILLRVIQQRYRLTQWQLAHRLGCDHASILFFMNGKRRPSERFLNKLSDAFPEYGQSISMLRKKDGEVFSVEDITENLIDGVLIVRPFGSKLSATFKNEGILVETEGIEFLYPYREGEMLRLELEKFPDEGFKVIGVLNKVMIEGMGNLKELMKNAGKLSKKLGIGGIVFSSCSIDGKQELTPDSDDLQELNYALYDLGDYIDFMKSKTATGTLAEAMANVKGAISCADE